MSPKTVADVLKEVWEADERAWVSLSADKSVSMAETPITEGVMILEDARDVARARVAACAPEALKLLMEINDTCRTHDNLVPFDRIEAILKKAGLP